jgi:hypothetical protein
VKLKLITGKANDWPTPAVSFSIRKKQRVGSFRSEISRPYPAIAELLVVFQITAKTPFDLFLT